MVKRACVLGLSDIGRSPRLQNHAVSLAKQGGYMVDVVGYKGSAPLQALASDDRIFLHYIPDLPVFIQKLPRPIALPIKAVFQFFQLLFLLLFDLPRPDLILLQVPPAIPSLMLCWVVSLVRGAFLVIDWHNFAYTLMALTHGQRSLLVRMSKHHEKFWGKRGDAHLCVTRAMQTELREKWGIAATVFYDRAPGNFKPCTLEEKHAFLLRLNAVLQEPMHRYDCIAAAALAAGGSRKGQTNRAGSEASVGTVSVAGRIKVLDDAPALLVSSTSWTPDEDFSLLLRAAEDYDNQAQSGQKGDLPRLLIFVTGKGPQKEMYVKRMQALNLSMVAFRTLWLEPSDYPLLLGCCDAGISLHTSSSGLDLPMKVVDMFGCGLPVFTAAYPCISELVQDRVNGLHFSSSAELGACLAEAFAGFPRRRGLLDSLRKAVCSRGRRHGPTWETEWQQTVLPMLSKQKRTTKRVGT